MKETWAVAREYDRLPPSKIPKEGRSRIHYLADGPKPEWAGRTRVSIHMTRWASRITLEIADVRVERLQSMTPGDAIDEGAMTLPNRPTYAAECEAAKARGEKAPPIGDGPLQRFRRLWVDINGQTSWDANPYVWVVEFRKLEVSA